MKNIEQIKNQDEKDINYIFLKMLELIKEKGNLGSITIFFGDADVAEGFVRQGGRTYNEYIQDINNLGKNLKPKLSAKLSLGQMSIAHHRTKLTSSFIQNDPDNNKPWEGWEEVW